jgi:hypothetical protein
MKPVSALLSAKPDYELFREVLNSPFFTFETYNKGTQLTGYLYSVVTQLDRDSLFLLRSVLTSVERKWQEVGFSITPPVYPEFIVVHDSIDSLPYLEFRIQLDYNALESLQVAESTVKTRILSVFPNSQESVDTQRGVYTVRTMDKHLRSQEFTLHQTEYNNVTNNDFVVFVLTCLQYYMELCEVV